MAPVDLMTFVRREVHNSASHHSMWRRSTSVGLDEIESGTYATDETKDGPGRMSISATIQTLTLASPPCCVSGAGAVCGVPSATGEEHVPRLSRISPAIQVEVVPETEPDNTSGQLSLHP